MREISSRMLYAFIWQILRSTQQSNDCEDTICTRANEIIKLNKEVKTLLILKSLN